MTSVDRPAFLALWKRVCRTFNHKLDAEQFEDYFTALASVTLEDAESASDALCKSSRYWPKPVDWLEAAQRCRKSPRHFSTFAPPVVTPDGATETTFYCHICRDTGWRPGCGCEMGRLDLTRKCPAHPFTRHGLAYPEPVKPCQCRNSNPSWLANHETKYIAPGDAA